MNKQMKQHLETVVNSIVNEDTEAATAAFHEYLRMKTQTILLGEGDDEECDEDEKDEDKDEDEKDEDKEDKKSKKENPFAKKDEKDEDKDEEDEK